MSLPVGLTFKGRFSRGQFWRYWLGALLGLVLLTLIGAGLSQLGTAARIAGRIIWVVGLFGVAWFSAATQVKRWHDLNRSGWMLLIIFIPFGSNTPELAPGIFTSFARIAQTARGGERRGIGS